YGREPPFLPRRARLPGDRGERELGARAGASEQRAWRAPADHDAARRGRAGHRAPRVPDADRWATDADRSARERRRALANGALDRGRDAGGSGAARRARPLRLAGCDPGSAPPGHGVRRRGCSPRPGRGRPCPRAHRARRTAGEQGDHAMNLPSRRQPANDAFEPRTAAVRADRRDETTVDPAARDAGAEERRLRECAAGTAAWRRFGPYLAERQWGTVREDYSEGGSCWDYLPHDHARSRAYRWGEDGLLGICDDRG